MIGGDDDLWREVGGGGGEPWFQPRHFMLWNPTQNITQAVGFILLPALAVPSGSVMMEDKQLKKDFLCDCVFVSMCAHVSPRCTQALSPKMTATLHVE